MPQSTYTNLNSKHSKLNSEDTIDIKKALQKAILYWPAYLLSLILCILLSFFYARYSHPEWRINSKLLIKDGQNGSPQGSLGGTIGGNLGSIFNVKSSADNEIQILKSRTLMQNVVRANQLNVRTYQKDGFKKREVYEGVPFKAFLTYKVDTIRPSTYIVKIVNSTNYELEQLEDGKKISCSFNVPVKLSQFDLTLIYKAVTKPGNKYEISIDDPEATVDIFSKRFSAVLSDKLATTIDLGLAYENPAKGEAILNSIMQLYLSSNIQNEKELADSTYAFINSRIQLVSLELNSIEKQFERFKVENNIVNLNEQSKTLVNSASQYNDKLAEQETQLLIIQDLEKYLDNPKNSKVIPSSLLNPTDQSFGQAINSYNNLIRTRDQATLSYTETNPVIVNIDAQINNARLSLLRNIETYKQTLKVGQNQLRKQNSGFEGKLRELPVKERNYLDLARQQNLKQDLYLFLLQKREETAISKNSTISSARIIDNAKSDFYPYKPKVSIIIVVGFILGLLIPSVVLMAMSFLNVRIRNKSDIENATDVAILGEIGHNSDKQSLVTGINSRSVISEQFRSLRTNIQFVLNSQKSNVILFTSSMSGEGKSFLSLNIGSSLALTGKKVVFLEMDLRKPKLSEILGLTTDRGFTNYAISDSNYNMKELLKPLSFNPNCFLVSSGPIPPNPTELLLSDKMDSMITYLKNEFDYVIIDCAPVGLVTDALILQKFADLLFYVTRQNFTYKSQLSIINEIADNNSIKNLYIIVNDISLKTAGVTGYKQSYGYGIEDDNRSWLQNLKFWKN